MMRPKTLPDPESDTGKTRRSLSHQWEHRVNTHTAKAYASSTPVPWRWRSRAARIKGSERDVLYAAGIFDGEGSIGINRNRTPKGSYRWWLVVSVANIDMRLHIWLQATFGGHVRVNSRKNPARPCYHWTLTSRQAADFLKLLSPFLKIKGEQAAVGMEFQEAIHQSRDETGERAARLQLLKDHLETLR
jgi:hypothetical protein